MINSLYFKSVTLFNLIVLASFAVAVKAKAETYLTVSDHFIKVVNESQQPISGASIMIGHDLDDPFQGNLVRTDLKGLASVPTDWKMALPVTISSSSYITTTFANIEPTGQVFQLHQKDLPAQLEVKGDAIDFEGIRQNGRLDFALIFPALTKRQLLQFDAQSIISPQTDRIRVVTENIDIPSNISLPRQRETYIIPITFNKPTYRMYVKQPGQYRMTAAHGQFPLRQVINDFRSGKSFFEIINHFRFLSGGQKDVQVNGNIDGQDISVNRIPFNADISVTAPQFADENVMISLSLVEQSGLYFPSDLKRVMPGETMNLKVPSNAAEGSYVVSLLTPKSQLDIVDSIKLVPDEGNGINGNARNGNGVQNPELFNHLLEGASQKLFNFLNPKLLPEPEKEEVTGLSLAMSPADTTPEFIGLVRPPELIEGGLKLTTPEFSNGIMPVATYVIFSEITPGSSEDLRAEERNRLWEVFVPGWTSYVSLPQVEFEVDPTKQLRWEVFFLGRDSSVESTGEYFLDGVTHLSRNSLDL